MTMVNDLPSAYQGLTTQITSRNAGSAGTAAAGELTGSGLVIFSHITGANPGNFTTRTPAQMVTDSNLYIGQTWLLIIANNQGTGTLTVVAGAGATVNGTAGVLIASARLFTVNVVSLTAITFTGLAISWGSAV